MLKVKKYRWITILVMVLTLFIAGCTSSDSSTESESEKDNEGKTVKVLLSAGGVGQFNSWKARSKEFTEETGIKVEFIETPYENLLEDITTDGIANSGNYDLVVFLDTMQSSITPFLEPLNDYIEKDKFNTERWPQSIVDLSTVDNKLYSLPVRANVQMLFYRQDVLDQLGLSVPTTWEEFDTVNKKITEETDLSGVVPYYGAGNNGQNLFMWTSYLWSNGGDIFDKEMKPIFNSPEGMEATKRYLDLLVTDKVAPPGSVTYGEQDSRTFFKQGKAAMWLGWWWVYSEFNDPEASAEEVAGNVKFASVPSWEGKENSGQVNVSSFPLAMMKGSKNKDAAWEVLKWIAEPEEELEIVTNTLKNEIPSEQYNIVATQKETLQNAELNELTDGFYNIALDSFENSRTLPQIKEWPQIADILSKAISNMATGKDVESELNGAAKKVEQVMDEAGYYK